MTEQNEPRTTNPNLNPTQSAPSNSVNVNKLGYFLDGWADLVEGMGNKAEEVRTKIGKDLLDRNMPDIQVNDKTGYVGVVSSEKRAYTVTTTSPGATTTIYIGEHGKDLYASWRTFIRPVLNDQVIFAVLGISAVLGFLTGGLNFNRGFSIGGWITSTIGFSIAAAIILGFAGLFFKGSFLAFFFKEPNVFDAEDITAMGLSAHKTVLRALDTSGIDVSKLRLKRDFQGGRKGEVV